MFYQEDHSRSLRLGDVLEGYLSVYANVKPPSSLRRCIPSYEITVSNPQFVVVMTPCCSIDKKRLSLAPLENVISPLLQNDNIKNNLVLINKEIDPQLAVPPKAFAQLPDDKKNELLARGKSFTFNNIFIYEKHNSLLEYFVPLKTGREKTGFYMVDFTKMFTVNCDQVVRGNHPMDTKILELTPSTRGNLRVKLAKYFSRIPEEDTETMLD